MYRETLRSHLHNFPLVQAIEQKHNIDDYRRNILKALQTLRECGISNNVTTEVQLKYEEYSNISRGYGRMLEDVWGISWQEEEIIRKYTDCCDDDIDQLPSTIKAA